MCRFMHDGDGLHQGPSLTEEKLAKAFEEMKIVRVKMAESDDEDDDVEIVSTGLSESL